MTDPKNIVIKVKYTAPDSDPESQIQPSKMVTEWNIRRILGAVGVVVLLIAALYFLLRDQPDKTGAAQNKSAPNAVSASKPSTSKAESHAAPADAAPVPGKVDAPLVPSRPSISAAPTKTRYSGSGRVRRAELAYHITGKEPVNLIGSTVNIGKGKPVRVYYFTEIRGKTAQILFHEWLKDGRMILRHPVTIAAERWRTSSQREFGPDDLGHWSARTVDDQGGVMNEISFTVSGK
jgi:hypothetical protein